MVKHPDADYNYVALRFSTNWNGPPDEVVSVNYKINDWGDPIYFGNDWRVGNERKSLENHS